ncbi:MAG: DNA repair protein RadC [Desulfarculaceae bacterium]|nr:DNA repair protein RadC [Desulfarculaceae bacterium]MCF8072562.1 DNA repair protein RadC [Desulfarculaceae bacterium]MCF8103465.1 DNA repair protein RadC [Desulfarculaceae bacterium]MCF8117517.1 DNA repair protein RadC [Desulfarculaceae bacterium]
MSPAKNPAEGHRARLRDKFLAHGLTKFTDEEALELLLTLATPRRDCKQQARALLASLGSLRAVLEAAPGQLAAIKGIGPKNILGLKLVPAVARRYLEDKLMTGGSLADPAQAAEYLRLSMGPLKQEVFRVLLLDSRRRVLANEELFAGTLNQAVVYPREVAARALAAGAAAVVAAHNHPGGDPTPSREDRSLTRQLYFALRGVGLELVDHLVVGGDQVYSFHQQGELVPLAREYDALHLEEMGP